MTTIAVRGTAIAADTQTTDGNGIKSTTGRKLFEVNGGLVGVAGDLIDAMVFVEWLRNPKKARKPETHADFLALELRADGKIYMWNATLHALLMEDEYYAIGSGAPVAMGAMFAGSTAEQAVRAAIKWDAYSSGGIAVAQLQSQTQRRRARAK
jgi:20S proteasome alpha/beta subunit